MAAQRGRDRGRGRRDVHDHGGRSGQADPQGPQGIQGPRGHTVVVVCVVSKNGKSVVCDMGTVQSTTARIRASVRLAGSSRTAVRTGRHGKVRVRLGSARRIARSSRVVVKVKIAGRSARMTVPLGHKKRLALKR